MMQWVTVSRRLALAPLAGRTLMQLPSLRSFRPDTRFAAAAGARAWGPALNHTPAPSPPQPGAPARRAACRAGAEPPPPPQSVPPLPLPAVASLPPELNLAFLLAPFVSSAYSDVCSLKVTLADVPGGAAEELGDLLLAEGATSVGVEEFRPQGAPEQKIFANGPAGAPKVWSRCAVVAYFPAEAADAEEVASGAAAALGLPPPVVSVEAVRAQDWEAAIKDSYQPVEVASGLWIVPTWCVDSTAGAAAPWAAPGATQLILEPGLAFGTGDHPTTRLCLRWLQGLGQRGALGGAAVMDYGTGSGVLAVAALLLGAARAVGTDVEPLAVRAAAQNAALNAVAGTFSALRCGADLAAPEPLQAAGVPEGDTKFGVVVANILRGPLLELAPRLAGYAAPGAALGLSGILESQAPGVIEAYSPWFEGFEVAGEEGWALVTATRRRSD